MWQAPERKGACCCIFYRERKRKHMENTCLQYENSLTRQAEESMDIWTENFEKGTFCYRVKKS